MDLNLILQIAGLTLGLLYLWWEYHADHRMWIVGMVMSLVSLSLYFRKGLYADFAINIYYFLMPIYGYLVWTFGLKRKNSTEEKAPVPITHAPPTIIVGSCAVIAILWAILWAWLEYWTDSNVPIPDAFTTAGSIVATWMLARKYVEQWIIWIVVDAVSVALYIYKGIPLYAILYTAYTVVAILGYRLWSLRAVKAD